MQPAAGRHGDCALGRRPSHRHVPPILQRPAPDHSQPAPDHSQPPITASLPPALQVFNQFMRKAHRMPLWGLAEAAFAASRIKYQLSDKEVQASSWGQAGGSRLQHKLHHHLPRMASIRSRQRHVCLHLACLVACWGLLSVMQCWASSEAL